jgi:phasin family protein
MQHDVDRARQRARIQGRTRNKKSLNTKKTKVKVSLVEPVRSRLDKHSWSDYAAMQQESLLCLYSVNTVVPGTQEAVTMNTELFNEWVKLSKNAVEPMIKLNEITVSAMERVARQQLDVARDYLDLGTRQASLLSKAESPEEMLTEQGRMVSEFGERLINRAQEFARIATETQQAVATWAEDAGKKATGGTA